MLYTDLTKTAMRIAYDAHKEQTDKSGLPYIFHPFHLAEQMTDEISVCVALLHDVVEDTGVTFADLAMQGLPETAIEALKLLTHDGAVPYMDYIQKIRDSGNQTAIAVKLADLRHNSDEKRLHHFSNEINGAEIHSIDEKASERMEKYKAAINILEGCGKGVYIEEEVGTGLFAYVLRVDGTAICSSGNLTWRPGSNSAPIQTDDLINKKTFSTYRNPEYKEITIVPGLKLEYPVYGGDNPKPVAQFEKVYKDGLFAFACEYIIYDEGYADKGIPFPRVSISANGPLEPAFLEWLPENDVCVDISPDQSFVYDSRSLVEKRYVVSIAEQHLQWLPHVFHAYLLRAV